jgi:hypothetical protein
VTIEQLAGRRRISLERAAELVAPLIAAGILEERDGLLIVVDPDVSAAFVDWKVGA